MQNVILVVIYILAVVAPTVFWAWFFRYLDRKEPEPKKLLYKIFRLGFIAMAVAAAMEFFLESIFHWGDVYSQYLLMPMKISLPDFSNPVIFIFFLSFFLAGPIEELVKYVILRYNIFRNSNFNQVVDGVVYGVTLALGFSFVENTIYFLDIYRHFSGADFFYLIALRGFSTTLIHVVSTGILGLYLGRARFAEHHQKSLILRGVILASVIHGVYNVLIFVPFGLIADFFVVMLAVLFLAHEFKNEEFVKIRS